jgi:LynF/TruF/PatF family peptide O-prenyltransferase
MSCGNPNKKKMINPLIRLYAFHKNEFNVNDDAYLKHFEDFMKDSFCTVLECSPQITIEGIHAARFRAGYGEKDVARGIRAIRRFLDITESVDGIILNRSIFDQILDSTLDVSHIRAVGVGIDRKADVVDSNVKVYCLIDKYIDKQIQVLSFHSERHDLYDYIIHDDMVFGIDMKFNGHTGVEIYPYFDHKDFQDPELSKRLQLHNRIIELISECETLNISFAADGSRVFHFFPKRPTPFIHLFNDRRLDRLYSSVRIFKYLHEQLEGGRPVIVSIAAPEQELVEDNLRNINFYYTLYNH